MQLNHSLDDGTTGLAVVGVSILEDKVDILSVTVDVSIVACTTISAETTQLVAQYSRTSII